MLRVSLFDEMALCTDAEVERMLPLVPESRRSRAMEIGHLQGRFASLKSYLMLSSILKSDFSLDSFNIAVEEHGKPYLLDSPQIHFSISHCRSAIAVAVSDQPVGIDAESFRPVSDALLDKCMNADEKAAIISSGAREETFAAYWTRKEAVFKLLGTGITDNLHDILSTDAEIDTTINREKGYAVSIALFSGKKES